MVLRKCYFIIFILENKEAIFNAWCTGHTLTNCIRAKCACEKEGECFGLCNRCGWEMGELGRGVIRNLKLLLYLKCQNTPSIDGVRTREKMMDVICDFLFHIKHKLKPITV